MGVKLAGLKGVDEGKGPEAVAMKRRCRQSWGGISTLAGWGSRGACISDPPSPSVSSPVPPVPLHPSSSAHPVFTAPTSSLPSTISHTQRVNENRYSTAHSALSTPSTPRTPRLQRTWAGRIDGVVDSWAEAIARMVGERGGGEPRGRRE